MVIAHPSLEGDMYFVALNQTGPDDIEHLIAFSAKHLTRIELKYGFLTTLVSLVAWAVRKLH